MATDEHGGAGLRGRFWRALGWTSVLLAPVLAAIWIGLNVVRVHTYLYAADAGRHAGDFRQTAYWHAIAIQHWIPPLLGADLILGASLAVAHFIRVFRKARQRAGCVDGERRPER